MNLLITIFIFIGNIYLCFKYYKKVRDNSFFFIKYLYGLLFMIHFGGFILFYTMNINIDSILFYENALNATSILELGFLGSSFMSVFVFPFVKMGVSYFTLSFLFASISFFIFLRYFELLFNLWIKNNSWMSLIFILFLLTPSLHYWTGGLNKEALLVFFMGIIFFQIRGKNIFSISLILSLIFILFIRPYVFILLVISLGLHIFVSYDFSMKFKKKVFLFLGMGILISIPILSRFFGIESINMNYFGEKYEEIILYSDTNGLSSIDLKKSNYLERIFLVLFRPLFYDAKTFFQFIISLENILFMLLIFKVTYDNFRTKVTLIVKKEEFLFISSISLILFYSIYMYNLGLASRMRVMFMPYIFVFLFLTYIKTHQSKIE